MVAIVLGQRASEENLAATPQKVEKKYRKWQEDNQVSPRRPSSRLTHHFKTEGNACQVQWR